MEWAFNDSRSPFQSRTLAGLVHLRTHLEFRNWQSCNCDARPTHHHGTNRHTKPNNSSHARVSTSSGLPWRKKDNSCTSTTASSLREQRVTLVLPLVGLLIKSCTCCGLARSTSADVVRNIFADLHSVETFSNSAMLIEQPTILAAKIVHSKLAVRLSFLVSLFGISAIQYWP